jgi:hypothetical protein
MVFKEYLFDLVCHASLIKVVFVYPKVASSIYLSACFSCHQIRCLISFSFSYLSSIPSQYYNILLFLSVTGEHMQCNAMQRPLYGTRGVFSAHLVSVFYKVH